MKKTYQKPAAEAISLGLKGEDLAEGLTVVNSLKADPDYNGADGGNCLVGEEKDWTDSSNFWGD